MRLFITEKAGVGRILGEHFGIVKKGENFIESKAGYITWCRGHLLGAAMPGAYGFSSFPGSPSDLPIVPKEWKVEISEDTKKLLETIRSLVNRKDVTEIVHAGDSEREGQLIVDEVLTHIGNTKPVKRLWVNAYNPSAIDKGMQALEDNEKRKTLYMAALARERADWLVGMNMSRLACMIAGTGVYSVGRVQTPVLALIAKRQKEIENFVSKDFYVPEIKVKHEKGAIVMEWAGHPEIDRIYDPAVAKEILAKVPQKVELRVETKAESVPPPLPYCLATLQVWASKAVGISPSETLERAQELYLGGYITYPRVDCEYYPEEEWKDAKKILPGLKKYVPEAEKATPALKSRAWNTKKTEGNAHYALMPTEKVPANLPAGLQPLYEAIAKNYVAQFYPNLQLSRTKISTETDKHIFATSGKIVIDPGWTVVLGGNDKDTVLPPAKTGDSAVVTEKNVLSRKTSPPKPFTQGNIIDAMRNIVRYLEDNPLAKKYLGDKDGLGRPSSQAGITDTLLKRGYIELGSGKDKTLVVTKKGFNLLDIVPEDVKDPIMTAFWERDFDRIEKKEITLDSFLENLAKTLKAWCSNGIPRIRQGVVWQSDAKQTGGKSASNGGGKSSQGKTGRKPPTKTGRKSQSKTASK